MLNPQSNGQGQVLLVCTHRSFCVCLLGKFLLCVGNVTVGVTLELKDRMKRSKSVNWSEVARKDLEDAARKEEVQCAAETIKNLRLGSKAEWDGAKEIRRWRDAAR